MRAKNPRGIHQKMSKRLSEGLLAIEISGGSFLTVFRRIFEIVFNSILVRRCRTSSLLLVSVDYVISTDITVAPEELPFSSLVINIFNILA